MTVSSTTTSVSFTGNGSTTSFAVTFPFQGTGTSSELTVVQRTIATGAETTLSYTTHYTVTGGSGSTGTVVAASAPANTVQWHIRRNTTTTQTVDYVTNDPFPADTHELALDRLAMAGQERDGDIAQAFKYPDTYTGGASTTMPEPVGGANVVFNADGTALTTSTDSAAQWLGGNGTAALPYYAYSSDPNTGFFRIGADNVGLSLGGTKRVDFAASGATVTGTLNATGAVTGAAGTFSGILKTDDGTQATSGTDGSLQTDGGLSVVKNAFVGGASTTIGVSTHGGNIVSDTDSTDDLGTTSVRWRKLWVDDVQATTTLSADGLVSGGSIALASGATITAFLDDDSMSANSATAGATQQSIKAYVDTLVSTNGGNWKASVLVGTTANITLSGVQTIDGVSAVVGSRVLVKDQSTASQNGIYVSASSTWARAADADAFSELVSAAVFVEKGSTLADTSFICTNDSGGSLGSTAVVWTQFGVGGGGGGWLGEGTDSPEGNSGDIIRINQQTLNNSVTMVATDNGSCTGPLTIADGVTVTISSGATFKVL